MERKEEGFTDQKAIVLPQGISEILQKDELTSLLCITDIGFYPKAKGHYRSRRVGSSQNILIYCTEGEGWCSINNRRVKVEKDQFFIIQSNTPHIYAASKINPWSIYWLHFTGEKENTFAKFYNNVYSINESPNARFNDRIKLFEEIYQNLEMGYSLENLQYTTLCLWHLLGSFLFVPQFREVNKIKEGDVIQESIKFMKQNIDKKLTLKDIADAVNYYSSHFGQLFQHKVKYTPLKYFNQLKIQKACQLLDFTDMKIKEIANKLDFYDQYHFSKVFTKCMGESPSLYRSKHKG